MTPDAYEKLRLELRGKIASEITDNWTVEWSTESASDMADAVIATLGPKDANLTAWAALWRLVELGSDVNVIRDAEIGPPVFEIFDPLFIVSGHFLAGAVRTAYSGSDAVLDALGITEEPKP